MKNNKTYIVLIPVSFTNSRNVAERIENGHFKDVRTVQKELNDINNEVSVYAITDFMDGVNDQELDILNDVFITYVTLNK